jgi:CMP-N-acetylneuraminic acid synthetase
MNRFDEKHEILAIIPARGGSKGIPRKNIKELCGKPLIAYSIEVALKSKWINRVIVSTEDEEIAEISQNCGAEVPFLRPAELAQDHSNMAEAVDHTMMRLRENGYHPHVLVILYPTHPFRSLALLDFLLNKAVNGYNQVITVKIVTHNPCSLFKRTEDARLIPLLKDQTLDAPPSSLSFFRNYGLFQSTTFGGQDKNYLHIIKNPISLLDIDTPEDFYMAEEVIKNNLFDFIQEEG